MQGWRMFAASLLIPSDTLRDSPIPAGMAGLGHKPRHKLASREGTTSDSKTPGGVTPCPGEFTYIARVLGHKKFRRVPCKLKPIARN